VLWFKTDEEIADLITLMNYCGVPTLLSCQDNRYNRGTVRRIWVDIAAKTSSRSSTCSTGPAKRKTWRALRLGRRRPDPCDPRARRRASGGGD